MLERFFVVVSTVIFCKFERFAANENACLLVPHLIIESESSFIWVCRTSNSHSRLVWASSTDLSLSSLGFSIESEDISSPGSLLFSIQGARLSISCYTSPTGPDIELCQLVSLSVAGFFIINCLFITPSKADGLSQGLKRQQVFSSSLESSGYSRWSHQCCSLNGLDSSSDFQQFHMFFTSLVIVPNAHITISITVTHVPLFF